MRPIKFRGVSLKGKRSGKVVYGDFIGLNGKAYIKELWCGMRASVEVDPDSIAQLVGYDANGKEVYEGDTVIEEYVDGERKEHIARLESMTQIPETAQFYFFPFPAPFTTLKEQSS